MRPALYLRIVPLLLAAGSSLVGGSVQAQQPVTRVPLAAGLTLVSTLQGAARESGTPDDAEGRATGRTSSWWIGWGRTGCATGGAMSTTARKGDRATGELRAVRPRRGSASGAPRVNLVFASSDQERVPGRHRLLALESRLAPSSVRGPDPSQLRGDGRRARRSPGSRASAPGSAGSTGSTTAARCRWYRPSRSRADPLDGRRTRDPRPPRARPVLP